MSIVKSNSSKSFQEKTLFDPYLELMKIFNDIPFDKDKKKEIFFPVIQELMEDNGLKWGVPANWREECVAYFSVDTLSLSECENSALYAGGEIYDVTGKSLSGYVEYLYLPPEDKYVCESILAYYHGTSLDILNRLIDSDNLNVRIGLAQNTNSSLEILEHMSRDKDEYVRREVALNPHVSVGLLEQLSHDSEYVVREAVAENFKTPVEILNFLSNDENYFVRHKVEYHLLSADKLEEMSYNEMDSVRERVARHPSTPLHILENLAKDNSLSVCIALASNRSLPEYIQKILLNHLDEDVRESLALNESVSIDILESLKSKYAPRYYCTHIEASNTLKHIHMSKGIRNIESNKEDLTKKHLKEKSKKIKYIKCK